MCVCVMDDNNKFIALFFFCLLEFCFLQFKKVWALFLLLEAPVAIQTQTQTQRFNIFVLNTTHTYTRNNVTYTNKQTKNYLKKLLLFEPIF